MKKIGLHQDLKIPKRLKRPMAAIRDCTEALKLNPDSAKAYKIRGKSYRRLRDFEKAHKDLAEAQKIDFDDDIEEIQKLKKNTSKFTKFKPKSLIFASMLPNRKILCH